MRRICFLVFFGLLCIFLAGCVSKKSTTDSTGTKRSWSFGSNKGNPNEDFKRFSEAAKSGNANATHRLAMCYMDGWGVERDYAQGFETLLKAAELGNLESKYRVALCYSQGIGTPPNDAEAVRWMTTAAREQHKGAREWLAKRGIYLEGDRRAIAASHVPQHLPHQGIPQGHQPLHGSDLHRPMIQTYSAQGQTEKGATVQVSVHQDMNPWNDPELIRKRERERKEKEEKTDKTETQASQDRPSSDGRLTPAGAGSP